MNGTSAPFIAPDTYAGRYTKVIAPGKHRVDHYTAGELAALLDSEFVIWESAGHNRAGNELFVRSRFVPQGDGSIAGYDSDGRRVIIHPPGRVLRILTN